MPVTGWNDAEDIDPDEVPEVPVPGTRPRVQHATETSSSAPPVWTHKGRVCQVGANTLTLYPVSVLVEVTGLKYSTIRKWEREGSFPLARYRSPARGKLPGHRLYTRAFIEGVRDLLESEGLRDLRRNARTDTFVRRVHALFRGTGG